MHVSLVAARLHLPPMDLRSSAALPGLLLLLAKISLFNTFPGVSIELWVFTLYFLGVSGYEQEAVGGARNKVNRDKLG